MSQRHKEPGDRNKETKRQRQNQTMSQRHKEPAIQTMNQT